MTQHTGLPVAGYKAQQPTIAIERVDRLKELEERVLRELDALAAAAPGNGRPEPYTDQRWLAIGRTQIQQGFMAATRSVFQPDRIALTGDAEASA